MNKRRKLIVALGAGALAAPLAPFAQPQGKVSRVGFLTPRWRPPEGYFANIPVTNKPENVFTKVYGYPTTEWKHLFTHWTGAALLRDYSPLGGIVVTGAGHEESKRHANIQGAFVLDLSALKWEYTNAPKQANFPFSGIADNVAANLNEHGEFADGTPYSGHTYLGVQELRPSEGGGAKGSIITLGGYAQAGQSPKSTHKMDVSKAEHGYSRFSTNGITGGRYPISVKDEKRGGFWLSNDTGQPNARLILNNGTVGATLTTQNNSSCVNPGFVLWPEKDLLMFVGGGYHSGGGKSAAATSLFIYDLANSNARSVAPIHGAAPISGANYSGAFEAERIAVTAGGSGYKVGDTITLTAGNDGADSTLKLIVAGVNSGAVSSVTFAERLVTVGYPLEQRGWYKSRPSNPIAQVSTSGGGTGATFSATWRAARDFSSTWYTGCHWCSLLGCIVAFDAQKREIVTLAPPQGYKAGDTMPWVWKRVPLKHWDAGDAGGTPKLNAGINGPYSKIQTVESLKALVLLTLGDDLKTWKPQIITLPGMG